MNLKTEEFVQEVMNQEEQRFQASSKLKIMPLVNVIIIIEILTPNSFLGSFWVFFRSSSVHLPIKRKSMKQAFMR
jgi:hypothetical protein